LRQRANSANSSGIKAIKPHAGVRHSSCSSSAKFMLEKPSVHEKHERHEKNKMLITGNHPSF